MRKLPLIITDVDGVLMLFDKPFNKVVRIIEMLRKPLEHVDPARFRGINYPMPLIFFTNNCNEYEEEWEKAAYLNEVFKLEDIQTQKDDTIFCAQKNASTSNQFELINDKNIICNYTTLYPVIEKYKDKLLLIGGNESQNEILQEWKIKKFITIEEYCCLFPEQVPLSGRTKLQEQETIEAVKNRIPSLTEEDLKTDLPIEAIFILGDCERWEGKSLNKLNWNEGKNFEKDGSETLPIYFLSSSPYYRMKDVTPRIGCGMLKTALEVCFKRLYNRELSSIITFGKPSKESFLEAQIKGMNLANDPISNIYMIGDSIKSDMMMADELGWETILICSGIMRRSSENLKNGSPAKYVVRDFHEAIKIIFQNEGIEINIPEEDY